MGPIRSPETSERNQLMLRNISEDYWIALKEAYDVAEMFDDGLL
jgi:hypothetical protein